VIPPRSMRIEAVVLASALFTILSGVGSVMVAGYGFSLSLGLALVLGMTLLLSASSAIAYYITKLCVDWRLEADNIGIPVVCATMDLVASWGYVLIVTAVYV
jgi:cation transporter-like permease